jgi:hypothetical protein
VVGARYIYIYSFGINWGIGWLGRSVDIQRLMPGYDTKNNEIKHCVCYKMDDGCIDLFLVMSYPKFSPSLRMDTYDVSETSPT